VRKELRAWLRRLHDDVHVTTVFVTHDQEEAMEVAEQIVVMNDGRVEQVGTPREVYEHPATEFVMGFVGPVTHVAGEAVRPHDVDLLVAPAPGATEAIVERIVHLGFEVRIELATGDGRPLFAQLTRPELDQLELAEGQILYVRPRQPLVAVAV
jgi:sulfate transport system ATP-binding protein